MSTWPRQGWERVKWAAVLGAALMGVALMAPSARADTEEMAVIETRAAIEADSDDGVNAALRKALERAIRGAAAMGLGQVQVNGAFRAPGYVVVQILARPDDGSTSGDESLRRPSRLYPYGGVAKPDRF